MWSEEIVNSLLHVYWCYWYQIFHIFQIIEQLQLSNGYNSSKTSNKVSAGLVISISGHWNILFRAQKVQIFRAGSDRLCLYQVSCQHVLLKFRPPTPLCQCCQHLGVFFFATSCGYAFFMKYFLWENLCFYKTTHNWNIIIIIDIDFKSVLGKYFVKILKIS